MVVNKDMSFCICYPFPDEWGDSYARGIVMARFLIFYAIPLSIITLFYIMIAKHLMYSANHVPGEIQGAVRQVSTNRCSGNKLNYIALNVSEIDKISASNCEGKLP